MIIAGGNVCPKPHGTGIDPRTLRCHTAQSYIFASRFYVWRSRPT